VTVKCRTAITQLFLYI